ncbi:MAG: hypothetical protein K6C99_00205 [Lachnospiraceae bacterium]|nr:hypothetical protein [Lachnospiraceae bacterium]
MSRLRITVISIVLVVGGLIVGFGALYNSTKLKGDLINVAEVDPNSLKAGDFVSIDVRTVFDTGVNMIEETKRYGVTTSSREAARYYEIPYFVESKEGIYYDKYIIMKAGTQYFDVLEKQCELSEAWWANENLGLSDQPAKCMTLKGKIMNFKKGDREYFIYPGEEDALVNCYIQVVNEDGYTVGLIAGPIMFVIGLIILIVLIKKYKDEKYLMSSMPKTSNNQYYGPQSNGDEGDFNRTAVKSAFAPMARASSDSVSGFASQSQAGQVQSAYGNKTEQFTPQTAPAGTPDALKNVNPMFGTQVVTPDIKPATPFGAAPSMNMDPSLGGIQANGMVSPAGAQSNVSGLSSIYGTQTVAPELQSVNINKVTGNGLQSSSIPDTGFVDPMLGTVPVSPVGNGFDSSMNSGNNGNQNQ